MAEKPNNHKEETKVPHSDSDISDHSSWIKQIKWSWEPSA